MWQQSKCLGLDEELVFFLFQRLIKKSYRVAVPGWASNLTTKCSLSSLSAPFTFISCFEKRVSSGCFWKLKSCLPKKVKLVTSCPSVTFSTLQEPLNWFQSIISWHTLPSCKGVSTTAVHLKIPILFKVQMISKH